MFGHLDQSSGFDGEHRRRPLVSAAPNSSSESKARLVSRMREDRRQRQEERQQQAAALVVQKHYRAFRCRQRARDEIRLRLDQILAESGAKKNLEFLERACSAIVFCFQVDKDVERLMLVSRHCVQNSSVLNDAAGQMESKWPRLIARLLQTVLCVLRKAEIGSVNISPLLRLLELFTDPKMLSEPCTKYIFSFLLSKGEYFDALRNLVEQKLPPVLKETRDMKAPLAQLVLQLVIRPLAIKGESQKLALRELHQIFFGHAMSNRTRFWLLPSLEDCSEFPFDALVSCLVQDEERDGKNKNVFSCSGMLAFLRLSLAHMDRCITSSERRASWLSTLSYFAQHSLLPARKAIMHDSDDDEDEEDEDQMEQDEDENTIVINECIQLLNEPPLLKALVNDTNDLRKLCIIGHQLLLNDRMVMHKCRFLSTIAFKPKLLNKLWTCVTEARHKAAFGAPVSLLTLLSRGQSLSVRERAHISSLLTMFTSLLCYLLATINDSEFYDSKASMMPFSLEELLKMSLVLRDVAIGIVELAYPDTRPVLVLRKDDKKDKDEEGIVIWSELFRSLVQLLRQLYTRDTRRPYCPENHWVAERLVLPVDRVMQQQRQFVRFGSTNRQLRSFGSVRLYERALEDDSVPLSTKDARLSVLLREMPYVFSFGTRLNAFHNLVAKDRHEHQVDYFRSQCIDVLIRRNFIYEDAFDKLSPQNEPNLKLRLRLQLMNVAGLNEAGVDGGGLFREFITELLKTAFDPNRGFFKLTQDQQLYPNPGVREIEEDFAKHYHFIGRMLGKAMYENHLVELPLASFFLSKLLGHNSVNVDLDHLAGLDSDLYRNLLYLKTYEGDVSELGLDFSVVSEDVGRTRVDPLKADGADVGVTNDNRIEYIHLVADFKLNKQIRAQCAAFREGLNDVVPLDWLQMFSYRELQTLISGSEQSIDVDDLIQNTVYSNGYHEEHETIKHLWEVVREMSEEQRRKFLAFVTSCSRPPLLGFKELQPSLCVQNVGSEPDRLPTASTCMNLLKLPQFKHKETLRSKLLYAIESGAGFELS